MTPGPSMPPPPGLFSITIGWPRWRDAISDNLRRCVSVEPPAGHGTISVIGRDGYCCASAGRATIAMAIASSVRSLILETSVSFGFDLRDGDDASPLLDLLFEELRGLCGRA